MGKIAYEGKVDYYTGCYRLHRKFSPVPMDLDSAEEVFSRLEGLEVNHIDAPQCCYKPEGAAHMIEGMRTRTLVNVCTGCYGRAVANRPSGTEVLMLPELVERAQKEGGA